MHKVFGDYIEKFPPQLDSLEMIFTPTADSIRKRWSNNRLSAQFVADYCSAFLPVDDDDPDGDRRIQESKVRDNILMWGCPNFIGKPFMIFTSRIVALGDR